MRPQQQRIIAALRVQSQIDVAQEMERSITFLTDYLQQHSGLTTLVLGISGGQDSTLAGRLCQLAVERLRATSDVPYRFIAVRLPYGVQADEQDAQDALTFIAPDEVVTVNIEPSVCATVAQLRAAGIAISDFNKGNIKARERMVVQYAIAQSSAGVVVGTDHAAEAVTGFYTKFGDGAADVMPLWRLTKSQGTAMLQHLGAPAHLYTKQPTADLEEERPSLPDEVALGVSYAAIDAYLQGADVAEADAERIESWYAKTEHKRRLPITVFDDFWRAPYQS